MATKPLTDAQCVEAVTALKIYGNNVAASRSLNLPTSTFKSRIIEARRRNCQPNTEGLSAAEIPVSLPPSAVYVVTCAQNATPINRRFFKSLLAYCKRRKAQLVIIPLRYKNPTSDWTAAQENAETWDAALQPYLFAGRADINDNLRVLGDIKIQPTAVRPLSGFESLSGPSSAILGHPKLSLTTVATPHNRLPKILATTGAVTRKNYTDTRTGKTGEFHHTFGALVVEVKDRRTFHLRQLNATRDGSFIDLEWHATPKGVKRALPAAGLVMGDRHELFADSQVTEATFGKNGIIARLKPKYLIWHDLLDFYSANHHHRNNPFIRLAKRKAGIDDVEQEVKKTCDFLTKNTPAWAENVIAASNHDEALGRWLRETDWRDDPQNAEFYLETALALARSARITPNQSEYDNPFHHWLKKLLPARILSRTHMLERNDSFVIKNIEVGAHGDFGANGSRGSLSVFRRSGRKSIIGHSHVPGIDEGAYQVGTSSALKLEYNRGLSAWLHCHCIIYANGKRSLLMVIDGNWRLPRGIKATKTSK